MSLNKLKQLGEYDPGKLNLSSRILSSLPNDDWGLAKSLKRVYSNPFGNPFEKKEEQPKELPQKGIIGFYRNQSEQIEIITSDSLELKTERRIDMSEFGGLAFLFGSWPANRNAREIPLALEQTSLISVEKSVDYEALPPEVKEIYDSGKILRTAKGVESDFSALMYVLNSANPQGRTGVLLHKRKPIVVNIDGKDFVVEVKGVGVPNGDNKVSEVMARSSYFGQGRAKYGGLEVDQGQREFRNLEILRNENSRTFKEGDSPRAALLVEYDGGVRYWGDETEQGYLLRLAPASIRASFEGNDDLPNVENRSNKTAKGLAEQFVEIASLESILIHTGAHPENLVLTNNGYKLTDFSDVRKLEELEDPHEIVGRGFKEYIDEIPHRTEQDVEDYNQIISQGLGFKVPTGLSPKDLAEEAWKNYFAPKVFDLRKEGKNPLKAKTLEEIAKVKNPDEIDREIVEDAVRYRGYREDDVRREERYLADADEWIPKFEEIQGDIDACKKFFEGRYDHLDDERLLELARSELERRYDELPNVKKRWRENKKKTILLKKYEDDPRKLVGVDSNVMPTLPSVLYQIEEYLKNEKDLLVTLGTEEARKGLRDIKERQTAIKEAYADYYSVVDKLRKNPNWLRELVELPSVYAA